METGQDHYLYVVENIENAVRESSQESPANFFVDDGIYVGTSLNGGQTGIYGTDKFAAETLDTSLVPFIGIGQFLGRLGTEKKTPAHRLFLSRLLTSSHGNAADGSFACALSRRSSSFLWASVVAIFSGEDATLSQRPSANCTRSATLNRKISSRRFLPMPALYCPRPISASSRLRKQSSPNVASGRHSGWDARLTLRFSC